jgi:hypothetical protein
MTTHMPTFVLLKTTEAYQQKHRFTAPVACVINMKQNQF